MNQPFTLIAHRGFSSRAPENTIEAFDLALEHGFDNFELDAQLTSDGVPVVIHDSTVDRTTNGTGLVSSFSLAELQALDAGSWFGNDARYDGAQISTLEAILERYAGRAHVHLELKSKEAELPVLVASLLKSAGWLEHSDSGPFDTPGITVTSFHLEQLSRSIQSLSTAVRHGWLIRRIDYEFVKLASDAGVVGLYPLAAEATADSVASAMESGFLVRGWGVGDEADLETLYRAGAPGTTVDWPDRAQQVIAEFSAG